MRADHYDLERVLYKYIFTFGAMTQGHKSPGCSNWRKIPKITNLKFLEMLQKSIMIKSHIKSIINIIQDIVLLINLLEVILGIFRQCSNPEICALVSARHLCCVSAPSMS
jgi:hypothetical protein